MSTSWAAKMKKKLSAKNVTAMLLFGAIVMVFVFFGLPSQMGGGFGAAARVNESFITFRDFQNASEQMEQMYSQYMGGRSFDPEQRKRLRQQALERLIYEELTAQAARRAGIRATDIEVKNIITKDIQAFQKDGHFQRDYYQNYLASQSMNAGDFEGRIRKQLESIRLRRLFEVSSHTLSLESEKQKTLQNYKMNLLFVKLDEDSPNTAAISSGEAQKALEDAAFLKKTQTQFELKKSQLSQPEQVHAQHILIMAKAGDTSAEKKAMDKIKALKAQSEKEDFGTLAQKNSEDPGSKAKKGDLGFFGRGAMVKEFEEVAFSLTPGKVSDPVKSPFGYHLIKVLEKKPAKEATFDANKIAIAQEILAREKMQKKSADLEAMIASNPSGIDAEIKSLGLKWDETGPFSLSADNIPKIQGLETEDLSGLSMQSPWLKKLARAGKSHYIIKLKDIKQESADALPTTIEAVQRRRADGIFSSWLQDFRKRSEIETNDIVLQ